MMGAQHIRDRSTSASSSSGTSSEAESSRSITDPEDAEDIESDSPRKRRKLSPVEVEGKHTESISRVKPRSTRPTKDGITNKVNGLTAAPDADAGDFASLGVPTWLVSSLTSMAIVRPTNIQRRCIPKILEGRDCIGGSRTGSGKTMAFAVPIIQKWAEDPFGIYAVVLTPTRELALQMLEQFNAISASQSLKAILVTGGSDMRSQALALSRRPHIVIATPGRLADHIRTSGEDTICGLRRVRVVVMDEADRLLTPGVGSMLPDVEECLSVLPPPSARQTLLFSATVTPEVRALKSTPRTKAPSEQEPQRERQSSVFICEVDTQKLAIPATLKQRYLQVPITHREAFLHVLLTTPANSAKSIIVFTNRATTADLLHHLLRLLDHRVTSLHSKLSQRNRIDHLARFRASAARILVATDVAARGLDIPEVGLVINYDLPRDPDDYIHRVGRTARAGRVGTAVSMVGQRDVSLLLAIEERVGGEKMAMFEEEGVSVQGRVVREALKLVGEKKREAVLEIEEGREVGGKRTGGMKRLKAQ